MSNPSQEHTSIRVHAPPGGHSSNIFSTSEFEQSAANKKKQLGSDIFGSNKDNVDPAPAKSVRNAGSNIFGTDPEETNTKPGTMAGQYKQTQMKSNIFGNDDSTTSRQVSDKNRSDIFGVSQNDDQNKRQGGNVRQGLRGGYNPINGEAYPTNNNVNSKTNEPEKQPEPENKNTQASAPTNSTENGNDQSAPTNTNTQAPAATNTNENGSTQAAATNTNENGTTQKPVDKSDNTANAQKNVHTSVRVFHPPGGKSNGPLW